MDTKTLATSVTTISLSECGLYLVGVHFVRQGSPYVLILLKISTLSWSYIRRKGHLMHIFMSGIVGIFVSFLLLLAWWGRRQINELFVFGGIGSVLLLLSIAGFIWEARWLWWLLIVVGLMGLLVAFWSVVTVIGIMNTYGEKRARELRARAEYAKSDDSK